MYTTCIIKKQPKIIERASYIRISKRFSRAAFYWAEKCDRSMSRLLHCNPSILSHKYLVASTERCPGAFSGHYGDSCVVNRWRGTSAGANEIYMSIISFTGKWPASRPHVQIEGISLSIVYENDMVEVPYSSCSMARCFRKEHVVGNQEMCCCFLYFERKNFAVNFMLTSGRFRIDPSGCSYSHVKHLFRLCRLYLSPQRVLHAFAALISLLP